MRCSYCHQDSDEPCVPEDDKSVFDKEVERLKEVSDKIDEEIKDWQAAAAAHAMDDDDTRFLDLLDEFGEVDDNEDDEDDWNGEYVSGPFDLSYLEAVAYRYHDGSVDTYEDPDHYYVTETGDHLLVFENEEFGVIITSGWRNIERFPRPGEKPFNIE